MLSIFAEISLQNTLELQVTIILIFEWSGIYSIEWKKTNAHQCYFKLLIRANSSIFNLQFCETEEQVNPHIWEAAT